jgi:hypothetical protein
MANELKKQKVAKCHIIGTKITTTQICEELTKEENTKSFNLKYDEKDIFKKNKHVGQYFKK